MFIYGSMCNKLDYILYINACLLETIMQDKAVKSSKQTNVLATGNDSDDDDGEHEQWQYQQLLRRLEPST